jgi:hypothetical protein
MAKNNILTTTNGKAAFYAMCWEDMRKIAHENGWAIALHGSLKTDLDIMAMPWEEGCKPSDIFVKALANLFETQFPILKYRVKPHNRISYSLAIFGNFSLDIQMIGGDSVEDPNLYDDLGCESIIYNLDKA